MTPAEIVQAFRERFGDAVVLAKADGLYPFVKVRADVWRLAGAFAKKDLACESLHDLTACDTKDRKSLVVHARLWSFRNRHWVNLKADVDRVDPRIDSLEPLWKGADWHERECWDMFGVRFEGHPNLRRILCPEDWVGFPLRKDYQNPVEYHGIPGIPPILAEHAAKGRVFPPAKKAAAPAAKPSAAAPAAAVATSTAPAPLPAAKPPAPPAPPAPPPPPAGGGA
jgi:NADH-quinone oxidoreductase subunit C